MKKKNIGTRPKAINELQIFRSSIRLLPALARWGVSPVDALAIAYNATFLFYNMPRPPFVFSAKGILSRYSLLEIAELCENVISNSRAEYGFNKNFKEAVI